MLKVSIICLIYKSVELADAVYESLQKYTPMLSNGSAEFFFVANDPTKQLMEHLSQKGYRHIINVNESETDDELFARGIGFPEYICRVYKGYNVGILHAKAEQVVLINSDHFFSPDWLENLLKYYDPRKIVASQIVEPIHDKYPLFPGALLGEFGNKIQDFDDTAFQSFVLKNKVTGIKKNGAYMPCLFSRSLAIYVGLYPEGNIAGEDFNTIIRFGDEDFFSRMARSGVEHITATDSIVFHLKEGELGSGDVEVSISESNDNLQINGLSKFRDPESISFDYKKFPILYKESYSYDMSPVPTHEFIMNKFSNKINKKNIKNNLTLVKKILKKIRMYNVAQKIKRMVIKL